MKNFLLAFMLAAGIMQIHAQIVIQPNLSTLRVTLKSQLWNLSLVNTGNNALQLQIDLQVTDLSNNQKIFTGTTHPITIAKGLRQLSANDLAPIIYNILNPDYHVDAGPDGFLPVGNFDVCYSVTELDGESHDRLAEQCEEITVEPISPPSLISPGDSEQVEQVRPLFTWLPPAPFNLFTNLSYSLTLVEVLPTQNGPDAIQQNIPLEAETNILTTNHQYPLSLPELDSNKLYAWQVAAQSGNATVTKSEVWTFRLKKSIIDSVVVKRNEYYYRVKRSPDAGYIQCSGLLKFAYLNEANDRQITYQILDITKASSKEVPIDSPQVALHYAQNLLQINFSNQFLTDNHIYLLQFENSKREHWYLKFKFLRGH